MLKKKKREREQPHVNGVRFANSLKRAGAPLFLPHHKTGIEEIKIEIFEPYSRAPNLVLPKRN